MPSSKSPDWRVVVEETITLLKKGKVDPAIGLLEALLGSECNTATTNEKLISPRKKRVPSRRSLSQSEASVKRSKKTNESPRKQRNRKGSHDVGLLQTHSSNPFQDSTKQTKQQLSMSVSTTTSSPRNFPRKLTKTETMGLIDFMIDPASLRSPKQDKCWGYIVEELFSTERDYIRDVNTIIDVFRDPMLEQGILTSDEAISIFSNISMILTVNGELLKQLESINKTETSETRKPLPPTSDASQELTKLTAIMTIAVKMEDNTIETKNVDINGLSTFQNCLASILASLPRNITDSYELYHENTLITDLNTEVLKYVGYDKSRLNFAYRRDALKKVHTVGGAMLNMAHYLKIYAEYCSNQANAVQTLNRMKKERPEVDLFLKSAFKDKRCRRMDLCSFLVMPLQRVCKYPLLLRELLSQTPDTHSDYASLREASRLIGDTVLTINEKGREAEQIRVMFDLQNNLDGLKSELIKPSRKFAAQSKGKLKFLSGKKGEEINAQFFVFNDILLVCTKKNSESGRYRFLDKIRIRNAFVEDSNDLTFSVGRLGKKRKILLSAPTEKEKRKAMDIIQKQILRDTYEDWLSSEKALGKTCTISYNDWYASYGKVLFG